MNLNQITLPSIDVNRAIKFYLKLGLNQIVGSTPTYARFECPTGDSTFSIHQVDDLPKGSGIIVYFECEDLDEKVKYLKSIGIAFETDPVDQTWLWREAHLYDPDGNKLILYYAGENRLNPPWRIN